jgi:hypothetical protein
MMWCIEPAATGPWMLERSPVLADREWTWVAVRERGGSMVLRNEHYTAS